MLVARRADPERAARCFPWRDTQDIREEIDRICPTYKGIASLRKKGDNLQYGGPRLLTDRFLTPDGKGRFSAIDLPEELMPEGRFLLSTRRGKQFNSMVFDSTDALTGARRDDILMALEDAERLGLQAGDAILLRNDRGELSWPVPVRPGQPGGLQGHWPKGQVLGPAGCLG